MADKLKELVRKFGLTEEAIGEVIGKISEEISSKYNEKQAMLATTEYMDWVERATLDGTVLCNDPYSKDRYDQETKDQVNKLFVLFDVVNEYAFTNYIEGCSTDVNYIFNYLLKYNGIVYCLSANFSQGSFAAIGRATNDYDSSNVIKYEDVMARKTTDKAKEINAKLEGLYILADELNDLGLPYDSLGNMVRQRTGEK